MDLSPKIQQFLHDICSKIPDTQTSLDTYNELLDHIECKVEWRMQAGYSEEEAITKALEEMGDASAVADQLGAIHSRIPSLDLGHALMKIFWGFLFSSFQLDFGYSKPIILMAGFFLLLAGAYQMRTCGKSFRRSFQGFCLLFLFYLITNSISVLPDIPTVLLTAMSIVSSLLNFVSVILLFQGLSHLTDCLQDGGPHGISHCTGVYIVMNLLILLALWIQGLFFLVFILFLGSLFYILRQIYSLRRELLLQDVRLPIQPFNVKSRTVFGAFSALFLIAPISCGYIAATPNPVQTSYSVIETDSSEQMADIRHRLLSNDLPEEMVMVLPPQELQRLAGMDEMSSHWQMYTVDEGNLSLIVAACRLDSQRTRLLYWFSWDEAPKHGFRDTIAPIVRIDPYFDSSFNSGSFQNPDETLLLLTQKDGQLYSMMPAAVRHSSDGTIQSLDVRVFPDIEAQYILYAITLNGDTSGYAIPGFTLDTAYTHRSSFFFLPYTDSSSSVTTALTSSYQHYVLTSHFRFNVESSELEP